MDGSVVVNSEYNFKGLIFNKFSFYFAMRLITDMSLG